MFKQLALAATLTAAATFSAPGAQAFGFKDALGIANTVVNTIQQIENGGGSQEVRQLQQPQQQTQMTASEQQQMDEAMAIMCSDRNQGSSVAAVQMLGLSDVQCSDEQNSAHDAGRDEARQRDIQCQAAFGESAYYSESAGRCTDGRPSVGSNLSGPGTTSWGATMR